VAGKKVNMKATCHQWVRFIAICAAWLVVSDVRLYAQAPDTLAGRTIEFTISSGTWPFAEREVYRFLPSATVIDPCISRRTYGLESAMNSRQAAIPVGCP
jgi:hypothetical protein